MRNVLFTLLLAALVTVSLAVPNVFNYQGKLTTPDGVGINDDVDITINIYDGPDVGTATLLCTDALTDVPVVLGLFDIQYEVALDQNDLMGDLYMELIVDGNAFDPLIKLTTVPFALSAQYTDSAYYSVVAESLGAFTAADLMPNDLQGAYDEGGPGAGRRIDALNGPVDIRTAYVGPSDGRALELRTNDGVEPALYAYNAGAGPAIFCSGDLRMNGTIWSNADLRFQLDKNGDPTNNRFIVVNDTNATVFSVGEHGNATVLNEIDFKAAIFRPQTVVPTGIAGKVYYDQTDNELKWHDGTSWQDFGSGGVGTHSLQDAYDDGNAVVTTGGNAVSITAGTGTALYVTSPDANGIWNDAGYWSPTGNISLGTGFYHTDNGLFQSNTDFIVKLDANDDEDASFIVRNTVDTDVLWVEENGDVYVTGFLNVSNITNPDGDSIWIDEKLWVEELVTDTIESRGDVVFLKDAFGIRDSLWFDGEWRKTWPTGGTGGDFIWDQDTAAQDADFWIQGQGVFGGVTSYTGAKLQIGTGTSTSTLSPFAGWYRWARNVSLITSAEIASPTACTIDTISIYLGSTSSTNPWTYDSVYIWLENTASATAPTTWDISGATQVFYAVALPVPQVAGWVHFDITDFNYSAGTDNLLIWIQHGYQFSNYASGGPGWRYTTQSTNTLHSQRYIDSGGWPTTLNSSTSRPNFRLSISDYPTVVDQVVVNNGDITADGDITAGGDVSAGSLTLDYTITEWPEWLTKLDTLWAGELGDVSDTIYAMDNFYINGELIVDSIQARGSVIFFDDDIEVDGCATFGGGVVPAITVLDEDFSDATFPPTGWTSTIISGTYDWARTTLYFSSSPASARMYAPAYADNQAELITPSFDISGLSAVLTFDHCQETWGGDQDSLHVYYRVSGADPWILLERWDYSIPRSSWQSESILLPSPSADYSIRFLAFCRYGYGVYIDDVVVSAPSGAAPPAVEICAGNISADGDIEGGTFTLNGVTISDWPTGGSVDLDTLWMPSGLTTDTMVAMAQFKVFGELIADSIQADGNIIYLDDSVSIDGALSLGADSTFRDDWEALYVVTVGQNNADFQSIDEAINAIALNGWMEALIDVAPGLYPVGMANIPAGVHLRGSGMTSTTILGAVTVHGVLSRVKVMGPMTSMINGEASYCHFEGSVMAGSSTQETRISNCLFLDVMGTPSITFVERGRASDCIIRESLSINGSWVVKSCEFSARVSVQTGSGSLVEAHITGCDFTNSLTVMGSPVFAFVDACKFRTADMAAIQVMEGAMLEAKANHFVDCLVGISVGTNGSAVILSNDFAANFLSGVQVISANRADIIGNSFVSLGFSQTAINISGVSSGIIKDNSIDNCLSNGMFLSMCPPGFIVDNNVVRSSIGNGILLQGGQYNLLRNTLVANGDGASSFDLLDNTPMGSVASYNVLDTYFPIGAFQGAFNTNVAGIIWMGIQTGQLP